MKSFIITGFSENKGGTFLSNPAVGLLQKVKLSFDQLQTATLSFVEVIAFDDN